MSIFWVQKLHLKNWWNWHILWQRNKRTHKHNQFLSVISWAWNVCMPLLFTLLMCTKSIFTKFYHHFLSTFIPLLPAFNTFYWLAQISIIFHQLSPTFILLFINQKRFYFFCFIFWHAPILSACWMPYYRHKFYAYLFLHALRYLYLLHTPYV